MSAFTLTLVQAVSPNALGKVYSMVPNAEAMKALLIAYDEPPGDGRLAMSCLTIERR